MSNLYIGQSGFNYSKMQLSKLKDGLSRVQRRVSIPFEFKKPLLPANAINQMEVLEVKKSFWSIVMVSVLSAILSTIVPASAQSLLVDVEMDAPPPRLSNGKPDFSGVWARPGTQDLVRTFTNENGTSNIGEPNPLPFTPWGQAQWDNYNPVQNGDYAGSCMPFGWIRSFTPHPMQILQNNEYISFLFEQSTMFQVVNTEGLPHRDGWPPTWFGDSRGRWDGDTLIIEAMTFNGWAKLGTIGHPMSTEAVLTMTFERPDMGHILFTWTLDDPKTYTRPIRNERVFVLTPDVEIMEYSCMEGNLFSLIQGSITPWLGSTDQDENIVYPPERQWNAYDETGRRTLTGVIQETVYSGAPFGITQLEVDDRILTIVLAPPVRMDFRRLVEGMLRPGVTINVQALPHRLNDDELRAEIITVNGQEFDMR